MNVISLLITILIIALIFGLVWWILGQMPIPEPFKMVVNVIVGLIAIILLLSIVFGGINVPVLKLN